MSLQELNESMPPQELNEKFSNDTAEKIQKLKLKLHKVEDTDSVKSPDHYQQKDKETIEKMQKAKLKMQKVKDPSS